jgi:hypothetical protein
VDAINGAVSIAFAPDALKTSEDQVHAFRIMLNITMPHFIGVSNAMSPAEAVFVTGFLTQQKLHDPDYKIDPQKVAAWAVEASGAEIRRYTRARSARLVVRQMPQEMVDVGNAFREQLPHEWSLVTISVHLFLDRAGLPR